MNLIFLARWLFRSDSALELHQIYISSLYTKSFTSLVSTFRYRIHRGKIRRNVGVDFQVVWIPPPYYSYSLLIERFYTCNTSAIIRWNNNSKQPQRLRRVYIPVIFINYKIPLIEWFKIKIIFILNWSHGRTITFSINHRFNNGLGLKIKVSKIRNEKSHGLKSIVVWDVTLPISNFWDFSRIYSSEPSPFSS